MEVQAGVGNAESTTLFGKGIPSTSNEGYYIAACGELQSYIIEQHMVSIFFSRFGRMVSDLSHQYYGTRSPRSPCFRPLRHEGQLRPTLSTKTFWNISRGSRAIVGEYLADHVDGRETFQQGQSAVKYSALY